MIGLSALHKSDIFNLVIQFHFMGKGKLSFTIESICGNARASVIFLPHGQIQTPVYMPVGTQGTLKGMTSGQIKELNSQIMLSNTFFLGLRPGIEILEIF